MVEPVHPLERLKLELFEVTPRSTLADELGLEQTDDRLGRRVIVGIAEAADQGLDPGLGQWLLFCLVHNIGKIHRCAPGWG